MVQNYGSYFSSANSHVGQNLGSQAIVQNVNN